MRKARGAWWGPTGPITWPGSDRYMLVIACTELARCSSLDESFEEVAGYIRRGETEFGSEYGDRLMAAVMAFGTDTHLQQLEALHASYNRMWERHPDLWRRIEARGLPTTLWLIDHDLTPRYGIIQPALNGTFEILSARDLRQTLQYDFYARSAEGIYQIAILPISAEKIEGSWMWWTRDPQGRSGR